MAEFCNQCGFDLFGKEGVGDLTGLTKKEDWERGLAVSVICEGCGFIQVDHLGNCASDDCLKKHGLNVKWHPHADSGNAHAG